MERDADPSWDDLIAAGIVNPPENPSFDLDAFEPLKIEGDGPTASELLERDREDRL